MVHLSHHTHQLNCVKRITLYNCLCSSSPLSHFSASHVQNTGASHIQDFGSFLNMQSHVCCDTSSSFCQKRGSVISKKHSSVRQELYVLRKKLFLILCSVVQKLYKIPFFSLLITNYLSVNLSVYLFISSIYSFNYTPCGSSYLPKSTFPEWRLLLNLGYPF